MHFTGLRWKAGLDLQNSHFPLKVSLLDYNADESHFTISFAILRSCNISLRTIVDARCVCIFFFNIFFSEDPCCDSTRNKIKQNDNFVK